MKKDIEKIVELPEGYTLKVENEKLTVTHNGKKVERKIGTTRKIKITQEGNKVKISAKASTRRELRMIGTLVAHIKCSIKGLNEKFVYKMEICNVHFPMNVKADKEKVAIKSFLGEKIDRIAQIVPNAEVEVKGNIITVSSFDKEAAGQTAANIEKATKLTGRDRRIFQDGIFITDKCGKEM